MNALRRQNKRPQQTLEDARLVRQCEAKRKQAPQREANVCRRRRQMQSRNKTLCERIFGRGRTTGMIL